MKKLKLHKKDTYGIEIEFATFHQPTLQHEIELLKEQGKLHRDWILKPEKTCDEYGRPGIGYEINSPVMDYHQTWLQELKTVLHLLEQYTKITTYSALHFHIGEQIFEENVRNLQDFLLLWCYYEPVLFRFSTGEFDTLRQGVAFYARPMDISMSEEQIHLLNQNLTMWEFLSQFMKDFGKTFAVNLNPYYYAMKYKDSEEIVWEKDTVEFRTFATSYQYQTIYAYLDMLLMMIEKAKHLQKQDREMYYRALQNRKVYVNPNILMLEDIQLQKYFKMNLKKAEEFAKLIYADEKKQKQFMKIYTCKSKAYE